MSDKPHAPTKRRLEQARIGGDVALSRFLVESAGLCAALVLLPGLCRALVDHFRNGLERALASSPPDVSADGLIGEVLLLAGPVVVAVSAAALTAGLAQTGASFTLRHLGARTNGSGTDASAGRPSAETCASRTLAWLAGVVVIIGAAWLFGNHLASLGNSVGSVRASSSLAAALCLRVAWFVAAATSLLGAVHLVLLRRARWKRLRMSDAELRREQRDEQGDAAVRHARRRTHRELADRPGSAPTTPESRES